MHTDRRHIRPRIHCRHGQAVAEIEMRPVRFIDEHLHPMRMGKLRNRTEIGADTIIGRIVDKYRLCIGMARNRSGDILHAHTECDAERIVDPGVDVDRNRTA